MLAPPGDRGHNDSMTLFAGIDIGSATAKAIVLGSWAGPDQPPGPAGLIFAGRDPAPFLLLLGRAIRSTGYDIESAGREVLAEALAEAGLDSADSGLVRVVSTGYGRHAVTSDAAVTEITCHARGAAGLVPGAATVIDVGGQDSKGIGVGPGGIVLDFVMNDKCAAGTGRFLEVMARILESSLDELGPLSLSASSVANISSTCTVFAESEVISQLAARRPKAEIVAGIHKAMARRVAGMARRLELRSPVVMTGGAARNVGLVRAVEEELGSCVIVPELAQFAGALGAAILAAAETR
jgi:predicted CoA-substrate-specific enzyme activase